jgi:hypothetical protein
MSTFSNSTSFMILGVLFLLFAFFQKHAISLVGAALLYIGYRKMYLSTNMTYLLWLWVILSILYDFRMSLGVQGNFLLL